MNKLTVRQRSQQTYTQTFHFTDPPIQRPPPPPSHCFHDIIEHHCQPQHTQQQKEHQKTLHPGQQKNQSNQTVFQSPLKSKNEKQKGLKGQLEEGGTAFFYRSGVPVYVEAEKLIPTDCSFRDIDYGEVGKQNEFAVYEKKNYDKELREKYDVKPLKKKIRKANLYICRSRQEEKKMIFKNPLFFYHDLQFIQQTHHLLIQPIFRQQKREINFIFSRLHRSTLICHCHSQQQRQVFKVNFQQDQKGEKLR